MSINKRIIDLRKFLKLSQKDFAELIDVSRQTISNLEQEKYGASGDVLAKILDKNPKLNAKWLVLGEGEMFGVEVPNQLNEPLEPYGKDYRDKYIQSLEREVELLHSELERFKSDDNKQKASVG